MDHSFDLTLWMIAFSLVLGVISNLLAKKIQVAPIIFFLGFGIFFGKSGINWLSADSFESHFKTLISLGISIILFEGGLTLDYANYRRIGSIVIKMLSLGVIFSWLINALAIYYLFDFEFSFAMFTSSLIIISGPTVIMPILRRISVTKKIAHILHWEGVLIDPIGVFLALLSFEIYISGQAMDFSKLDPSLSTIFFTGTGAALVDLILRIFSGLGLGALFGWVTVTCLNRKWIPYEFMNSFVLAMAITTFSVCDIFISESGLMGVVVAGLITGLKRNIHVDEIKKFKLEITNLFVGLLFILISANLDFSQISRFGWSGLGLLIVIIFLSRPMNVFLSAYGSDLSIRERVFLSWLAPRGIVSASMATIFTFYLQKQAFQEENIWFIETFTFVVIITTVIFQGFSAQYLARLLKLVQKERKEWVIIGAHDFSEAITKFFIKHRHTVTLIDNNKNRVEIYLARGLKVIHLDSLSPNIYDDSRLIGTSHVLALTDNLELNALTCQHWKRIVRKENLFRWGEKGEKENEQWDGQVIWEFLPKPSIISVALSEGKSYLWEESSEDRSSGKIVGTDLESKKIPLLQLSQEKFIFLDENRSFRLEDHPATLSLVRNDFALHFLIEPQLLLIEEGGYPLKDTEKFYRKMIEHIKIGYSHFLTVDQIGEFLTKKEERSICLGNEVAIIHFHHSEIKRPFLGLGVIRDGVDLQSYDQKKVKLVFILMSPKGDTAKHLWVVAKISKMVSDELYRKSLIKAKDIASLEKTLLNPFSSSKD